MNSRNLAASNACTMLHSLNTLFEFNVKNNLDLTRRQSYFNDFQEICQAPVITLEVKGGCTVHAQDVCE